MRIGVRWTRDRQRAVRCVCLESRWSVVPVSGEQRWTRAGERPRTPGSQRRLSFFVALALVVVSVAPRFIPGLSSSEAGASSEVTSETTTPDTSTPSSSSTTQATSPSTSAQNSSTTPDTTTPDTTTPDTTTPETTTPETTTPDTTTPAVDGASDSETEIEEGDETEDALHVVVVAVVGSNGEPLLAGLDRHHGRRRSVDLCWFLGGQDRNNPIG